MKMLNDEVQLFVRDVEKTIPLVDGQYQIQVRMADGSFSFVRFNTSEKAAVFLAALVVLSSKDVVGGYV